MKLISALGERRRTLNPGSVLADEIQSVCIRDVLSIPRGIAIDAKSRVTTTKAFEE